MVELSIILVHWKEIRQTQAAIDAIQSWSNIDHEIYIVQNEEDEDQFSDYNDVKSILSSENLGYGGGNNLALAHAIRRSRYSLLLNSDATIEEGDVQLLLQAIKGNDTIFSIGPVIEEYNEETRNQYYGGRDIASHLNTRISNIDEVKLMHNTNVAKVPYTIGTIFLLDNLKLSQVGLFDETYFFSGEVADLCYRAANCDYYSATCLDAKGYHNIGGNTSRPTLYKYYNLRNRLLYIKKHNLGWSKQIKWYTYLIKDLIYFLMRVDFQQVRVDYICLLHSVTHTYGNSNAHFR